jgi:hypothetical protein
MRGVFTEETNEYDAVVVTVNTPTGQVIRVMTHVRRMHNDACAGRVNYV